VATCEIKHGNNTEMISVFYCTCNHWQWRRWTKVMKGVLLPVVCYRVQCGQKMGIIV